MSESSAMTMRTKVTIALFFITAVIVGLLFPPQEIMKFQINFIILAPLLLFPSALVALTYKLASEGCSAIFTGIFVVILGLILGPPFLYMIFMGVSVKLGGFPKLIEIAASGPKYVLSNHGQDTVVNESTYRMMQSFQHVTEVAWQYWWITPALLAAIGGVLSIFLKSKLATRKSDNVDK